MTDCTFHAWPKTPRLEKPVVITEKIDGTNAQIHIASVPREEFVEDDPTVLLYVPQYDEDNFTVLRAGSRNRYLTLAEDNFGFAAWAANHAFDLLGLGYGRHYGEWWGQGIQRGYGKKERHFSLFNVARWKEPYSFWHTQAEFFDKAVLVPECCNVVPVLYYGEFINEAVDQCKIYLSLHGSRLLDDYEKVDVRAEGVVVYHTGSNTCFKSYLPGEG